MNLVDYEIDRIRPQQHIEALLNLGVSVLRNEITRDSKLQKILEDKNLSSQWGAYLLRFAPSLTAQNHIDDPISLDGLSSTELLDGFSAVLQVLGIETCIVLVDGLDEFVYTAEPNKAIRFIAPLIGTLSIIERPGFAFKFFLPKELETSIRSCSWFRPDRIRVSSIKWESPDLLRLVENRLAYFSHRNPKYSDLAELCDDELGIIIDRELFSMAGELPRNVLILADKLVRVHCSDNLPSEHISLPSWLKVKDWWTTRCDKSQAIYTISIDNKNLSINGIFAKNETLRHPTLIVNEIRGTVMLGELEIRNKLEGKLYTMLLFLYKHRGEVCNKKMIVENVWPDVKDGEYVTDQAIAANISRLRRILSEEAPNIKYIETIKGRTRDEGGYRLLPNGFMFG